MNHSTILKLPKVELHLHLDCSLSYNVVRNLRPNTSKEEYQDLFIAPEKCRDLAEFLRCTVSGINIMQTKEELMAVVADLFEQLKEENVIYAEIRFAPLQHTDKGLSAGDVVEIVSRSVKINSELTGIEAGLILCTLRHYSEEQSMQTIKLVHKYKNIGNIVGFDIVADEAGFPVDAHKMAFEYANKMLIPRTAHAGEAKGAESVWETLEYFKPQRIGHGVRSIEEEKLVEHLKQNKIHLEICPTCNIQTNIYEKYEDHPINDLYNFGVPLSVNTDARSLVNASLTMEYLKLHNTFNWGMEHFLKCNLNALDAAFINQKNRNKLKSKLMSSYKIAMENV